MADDEEETSSTSGSDLSQFSESGSADSQEEPVAPAVPPSGQVETPSTKSEYEKSQQQKDEYIKQLEIQHKRQRDNRYDDLGNLRLEIQNLRELEAKDRESRAQYPVPFAAPPRPDTPAFGEKATDGQDRKQYAGLGMNLIKWAAVPAGLLYLAFGRRNPVAAAAITTLLAGAARANNEGNAHHRDAMLKAWEVNKKEIDERNKEQIERYKELRDNGKLSFEHSNILMGLEARAARDYRMIEATDKQNIIDINRILKDKERTQIAWEKEMRADRSKWWKLMGKDVMAYRDWVKDQGGPYFDERTPAEELDKIEDKYPYSKFLDKQYKEELRKIEEKAAAKTKGEAEGKAHIPSKAELKAIEKEAKAKAKGAAEGKTAATEQERNKAIEEANKAAAAKGGPVRPTKGNPFGLNLGKDAPPEPKESDDDEGDDEGD